MLRTIRTRARASARRVATAAACSAALAAAPGFAATVTFGGTVDSGALAGTAFAGSLAYDDPPAASSGPVDLTEFSLDFAGTRYGLADADVGLAPAARFDAGRFLGVDYAATATRPSVQLVAGFFDVGEAFLQYGTDTAGGFGSIAFAAAPAALPAPGALPLASTALLLLAAAARRRRRDR